ncbi:MAG TPA: hypothetical protein VEW03_01810 [Longimicrobiaceae bacterium]|nr:hypothetical protein [Longimicrobiaceae bacterium]
MAALLAACAGDSDSPLAPPDAPARSGSQAGGDGVGVGSTRGGTTTSSTTSGDEPVPADSTGRGGHIVGGN